MDAPSCCVAGPARAALSPCQGVQPLKPSPHDKGNWRLEPARGLSWSPRLSGGATFLESTSQVIGMVLTRGTTSGGRLVSQEVGLPDSLA